MIRATVRRGFYLVVRDEEERHLAVEGPMDDDAGWHNAIMRACESGRKIAWELPEEPTRESVLSACKRKYPDYKLVSIRSIVSPTFRHPPSQVP